MEISIRQLSLVASRVSAMLTEGHVHVWQADLSSLNAASEATRILSNHEWARAEAFRFDQHRRAFIVTRVLARAILAGYVGQPPQDLQFTYNAHRKPALLPIPQLGRRIEFNLSHSANVLLIAVNVGSWIGIDIEHVDQLHYLHGLAHEYLTEGEYSSLLEDSSINLGIALLRYWVYKEAFLKAVGCGLSVHPNQVRVWPAQQSVSLLDGVVEGNAIKMQGYAVPCVEGYVAAVASHHAGLTISVLNTDLCSDETARREAGIAGLWHSTAGSPISGGE